MSPVVFTPRHAGPEEFVAPFPVHTDLSSSVTLFLVLRRGYPLAVVGRPLSDLPDLLFVLSSRSFSFSRCPNRVILVIIFSPPLLPPTLAFLPIEFHLVRSVAFRPSSPQMIIDNFPCFLGRLPSSESGVGRTLSDVSIPLEPSILFP